MDGTKKTKICLFSIIVIGAFICMMATAISSGEKSPLPVNLGSSGNYAILAKTGVTTTGTSMIVGNIAVSPIASTAITGFGLIMDPSNQYSTSSLVVGKIYGPDYADPTPSILTSAVSSMETAYTEAAGRQPLGGTELYGGNLGGKILTPGVYKWSTGVVIPTSTALTLDAKNEQGAVWIFQLAGDLTMGSASRIVLKNGANADNIFWQIAGPTGVTIGSGAHVEGNILTKKAITMTSGASIHGRALSQTTVTLINNQIS